MDSTVQEMLQTIEFITIQIADIIKASDNVAESDKVAESDNIMISDSINLLYDLRQVQLDKLVIWYHSNSGQSEIRKNSEPWNSRIQNLIQADSILVENLKRKMNESQIRLRTFNQQKSLLIYSNR